ncbi:AAA family ATPase [Planctomicrobium sp. SH668]|uniref:AAA family ATPase n=1 Tax=Planctomicrobium sp. SH668 TaxID=3448126 RepID=UPI003F5C95D8
MIKRIELKNFMSHTQTVIEPAEGLTVLVGPNNCGKSAVVAALQILCQNENSTYILRHGEKECSVTVETDDGHSVQWRRKTSPSYVINGQLFDRLKGAGLPEELHKALRLPRVDTGSDGDFDVHFGVQKSPIFLLGSSAANAARFFASSSDAAKLMAMQKLHKTKHHEANRDKSECEKRSKEVNDDLTILDPVVSLDKKLSQIEQLYIELQDAEGDINSLESLQRQLLQQQTVVDKFNTEVKALSQLSSPPRLHETAHVTQLIADISLTTGELNRTTATTTALKSLVSPPVLEDVSTLTSTISRLDALEVDIRRTASVVNQLLNLIDPPALEETERLARLIHQLVTISRETSQLTSIQNELRKLGLPPALENPEELREIVRALLLSLQETGTLTSQVAVYNQLEAPPTVASTDDAEKLLRTLKLAQKDVESTVHTLERHHTEITSVREALRQAAAANECSVCGSPLDPDRVIARAESGLGAHDHD